MATFPMSSASPYKPEIEFLVAEGDPRNYFAELVTWLNENFTTQEEMECRFELLCLDFAVKNNFELSFKRKDGKDIITFQKLNP